MSRHLLVKGHTLKYEGQPHDPNGRLVPRWQGKVGRAKCSCGWLSKLLHSHSARKRAHAEHKLEIQQEQS